MDHNKKNNTINSLNRTWSHLDKAKFYGFGFLFGLGVMGVCYPMNVIKTRLQVDKGHKVIPTALNMARTGGIRVFFKGYPTAALGNSIVELIYFSSFEVSKEVMLKSNTGESGAHFVGGLIAEGVSNGIIVPFDVITQRLMVQDKQHQTKTVYSGGLNAAIQIYKTDGLRGFFKGWGASYLTLGPQAAIWWMVYGWSKRQLYTRWGDSHEKPFIHYISGFVAGCISSILINPFDVAKTRLQVQDHMVGGTKYTNFFSALKEIYQKEGVRGMFVGVRAKMLYFGCVSALSITSYETVKWLSMETKEISTSI